MPANRNPAGALWVRQGSMGLLSEKWSVFCLSGWTNLLNWLTLDFSLIIWFDWFVIPMITWKWPDRLCNLLKISFYVLAQQYWPPELGKSCCSSYVFDNYKKMTKHVEHLSCKFDHREKIWLEITLISWFRASGLIAYRIQYTLPQKKRNFCEVAFLLGRSVGQWTLGQMSFPLVDMTWGHWPWSRVTIKNPEIKVAFLLGKSVVSYLCSTPLNVAKYFCFLCKYPRYFSVYFVLIR